jgi:glucosylceramidase
MRRATRKLGPLIAGIGLVTFVAGCHSGRTLAPASVSGGSDDASRASTAGGEAEGSSAKDASEAGRSRASQPEPSLITSGPGSYWNVGEVTAARTPANVTVEASRRFQTWLGFGGTFNEAGWDALLVLSEAERRKALRLLFDVTDGIGFSWGRIPIGASDYALERYTLDDNAGDTAMSMFSIAKDEARLIPYIKAAQAVKRDIKFWGSPWTPPPWMKVPSAYDGGYFDPQYMGAMAAYLVKWIEAYEAKQIPIDHVQPQNEPGFSQAYPSCAWGPSTADGVTTERPVTLGTFVEDHLAPAIRNAGLATKLWYGTLSNGATYAAYWGSLSPNGRRLIEGVGLQWGTMKHVGELASAGLLVMQSEHRCGNYPWLKQRATSPADADRTNFLATQAPNNHAYAEESWDLIKAWIEAGVNVYSAWNMVLDSGGFSLDVIRPWPQNALMAVDRNTKTLSITPAYYVFRHLGQYVDPGAVRVDVQGGNALSFQNPDGSIVTVLFNGDAAPSSTTLSVAGDLLQFEIPAHGWATVNWQG